MRVQAAGEGKVVIAHSDGPARVDILGMFEKE